MALERVAHRPYDREAAKAIAINDSIMNALLKIVLALENAMEDFCEGDHTINDLLAAYCTFGKVRGLILAGETFSFYRISYKEDSDRAGLLIFLNEEINWFKNDLAFVSQVVEMLMKELNIPDVD